MKAPFKWFTKSYIFEKYHEDPAEMLVRTGLIGWILSSAAQIFAIAVNEKLTDKEKMFLIPQEFADACVNCLSFVTLSKGIKSIGKKLTETGKLRTKQITDLLDKRGFILKKGAERTKDKVYAGDWNFNITKLDDYEQNIKSAFKPFNNGVEVITGLSGSILSTNLITPIFRNHYAAHKQKQLMALSDAKAKEKQQLQHPLPPQNKVSFDTYRKILAAKPYPSSDCLKI